MQINNWVCTISGQSTYATLGRALTDAICVTTTVWRTDWTVLPSATTAVVIMLVTVVGGPTTVVTDGVKRDVVVRTRVDVGTDVTVVPPVVMVETLVVS